MLQHRHQIPKQAWPGSQAKPLSKVPIPSDLCTSVWDPFENLGFFFRSLTYSLQNPPSSKKSAPLLGHSCFSQDFSHTTNSLFHTSLPLAPSQAPWQFSAGNLCSQLFTLPIDDRGQRCPMVLEGSFLGFQEASLGK